jgi:hypothetical protein
MIKKLFFCMLVAILTMGCSDREDDSICKFIFPKGAQFNDNTLVSKSATKLINSEEEYAKFVHIHEKTGINFSKKTLLVVYGSTPYGLDKLVDAIEQHEGNYHIAIEVYCNIATEVKPWVVAYVVPKLTDVNKVNVNTHYILSKI